MIISSLLVSSTLLNGIKIVTLRWKRQRIKRNLAKNHASIVIINVVVEGDTKAAQMKLVWRNRKVYIGRYASKPHMSKSVIVQERQKTVFNPRNLIYLSIT